MNKGILGKKVGMTQVFDEKGNVVPVTVVEAGPCFVVRKKTVEVDGYSAIQVGFGKLGMKKSKKDGTVYEKKAIKPIRGYYQKVNLDFGTNLSPLRYLREFRLEDTTTFNVGDELKADVFKAGDKVDISGISKGKGFQGCIKRHNFTRGPMEHGSMYHRRPGSMGAGTNPGRVFKGKKLPGHMGNEQVTVQNLDIVYVDTEKNVLLVKGAVPGQKGTLLYITDTVRTAK